MSRNIERYEIENDTSWHRMQDKHLYEHIPNLNIRIQGNILKKESSKAGRKIDNIGNGDHQII